MKTGWLPQSHMRFIRRGFPNTACSGVSCSYLYYLCKLAVFICLLCPPASTPPDQKSAYRGGVSFYSCVCFSRSQRVSLLKQGPLLITWDSYCVRVFVINWITVSLQSSNSVKDNALFGAALSFNTHSEKNWNDRASRRKRVCQGQTGGIANRPNKQVCCFFSPCQHNTLRPFNPRAGVSIAQSIAGQTKQ